MLQGTVLRSHPPCSRPLPGGPVALVDRACQNSSGRLGILLRFTWCAHCPHATFPPVLTSGHGTQVRFLTWAQVMLPVTRHGQGFCLGK